MNKTAEPEPEVVQASHGALEGQREESGPDERHEDTLQSLGQREPAHENYDYHEGHEGRVPLEIRERAARRALRARGARAGAAPHLHSDPGMATWTMRWRRAFASCALS